MIKEPIRTNCGEKDVREKDESIRIPSVGDEVVEKEKPKSEFTQIEIEDRTVLTPSLSSKLILFLSCLEEKKEDAEFIDFLKMFKALNVNLPLLELIEKMLKYAKFLREVMSRQRKIERKENFALNEECRAIVSRRVSSKVKDLGCFTIPIEIGGVSFEKNLCDLVRPKGVLEDVLVRVRKFIFPVDFIVLDFGEDIEISIFLGRPFLATSKATIDVGRGELTIDIEGETKVFKYVKLEPRSKEVQPS
ncbi:DNA damage-inducible protein 1-like [Gossypium australe]|uniref:DNA damage-inducible protein 1-like n=1 Tax=Gossypium australe TaxID=47621 RepID=A0A5B6VZS2_9ROSI|nr:DNA damage-inducible protein 1-like [Gossypium australe]